MMASSKKRKKKRKVNKKRVIVCFLVLAIIGLIIYYVFTMPIRNIYIKGNQIVTDEEIIRLAKLDEYPSFILTSTNDIKKNIKKNQFIENVSVNKKFWNVIEINVFEYQMVAMDLEHKIILSNGLKIDNHYNLSDIPVLVNNIDDENVYKYFAKKFEKVDRDILRDISQIEYSPVEVDKERFLLYMSDGNLVYITLTKIEKINKYHGILDKIGDKRGTIYLDAGDYMEVR